jgi:hypothetical protein
MMTTVEKEWFEAIGQRQLDKDVNRALTEPRPIMELLPPAPWLEYIPSRLRHLQLPGACSIEILSPTNRRVTLWQKATWRDIQAQVRILAEERAWGLLDAVEQLSRAVEPFMREHPARTLAEAMPLLSGEEAGSNFSLSRGK